ncbi:hypothetical protein DL95DRAFT_103569 [Leptodontidium sp. 2 PMI_412]|nr:hypothetical protein DL95DRAFT_103569 [Leptodontidium sp. 2 PMI_412]
MNDNHILLIHDPAKEVHSRPSIRSRLSPKQVLEERPSEPPKPLVTSQDIHQSLKTLRLPPKDTAPHLPPPVKLQTSFVGRRPPAGVTGRMRRPICFPMRRWRPCSVRSDQPAISSRFEPRVARETGTVRRSRLPSGVSLIRGQLVSCLLRPGPQARQGGR